MFAKNKNDYFVVFIYHNEVVVEWSFGGVTNQKRFRKDRFEGQWISLLFIFKDQALRGGFKDHILDDSPNFEANNFDIFAFTEIFKDGEIYVAGSDSKTFDYQAVIDNADINMTGYILASDTTTAESVMTNSLENSSEDILLYRVDHDKKTDNFKVCIYLFLFYC